MRTLIRALVVALLGLVALTLPAVAQESVTITLREQSGSGQSGTTVLTAVGNQTRVLVTLSNPPAGVAQPAHIHEGTCANLNPQRRYPLQSLMNGRSETVIDVPLSQLFAGSSRSTCTSRSRRSPRTRPAGRSERSWRRRPAQDRAVVRCEV